MRAESVARSRRWTICSDTPGRLRASSPCLGRHAASAAAVDAALRTLAGILSVQIRPLTERILVEYAPERISRDAILTALTEASSSLPAPAALDPVLPSQIAPSPSARHFYFATLNLVLVTITTLLAPLTALSLVTTLAVGSRILLAALRAVAVERRMRVDVLDAIVVGMLLVGQRPLAAALMIWILDIGEALLESTSDRSTQLLSSLFGVQERRVWVLAGGVEAECDLDELKPGDRVVVRGGEPIPVDGRIVDGDAIVDQRALTGESAAVERAVGEPVFARTTVLAGRIIVRVEQSGAETKAARIVEFIRRSLDHKVRLQSRSERFADRMVLPTLALGGVGYLAHGAGTATAILNADYGTGVRVAGPLALLASLGRAASHGIVIKDGAVLDRLCAVTAVVFDKTGTLTEETPAVGSIVPATVRCSEDDVLRIAAAAESRFSHPIARAIVQRAEQRQLVLPPVDDRSLHVGLGIRVRVGDSLVRIGSRRFVEREGLALPPALAAQLSRIEERGRSAVFAADEREILGMIEIRTSERPEAAAVVESLRARGIHELHLLSGDHEAPTRALAARLGIQRCRAGVLPQQKADHVRALQAQGHTVAMVGDGINDAVALSVADVSVSIRGAADIATDVADVIFMDGHIARFDLLWQIAQELQANVQRSVTMTLVSNSAVIAGALAGRFGIAASLVLNNGVNLLAALNGLRPYRAALLQAAHDPRPGQSTDDSPVCTRQSLA